MTKANKQLVRRYYRELMNEGKLAFIDQFVAPEFMLTNPSYQKPYCQGELKELVSVIRSAVPDLHFTIEHILSQGDTVVAHWIKSGTHTGSPLPTFEGEISAEGKSFIIDGISWLRVVENKIVEAQVNEDTLGLLQQIGTLPIAASADSASTKENEQLVYRYFNEILNEGKLDIIDEIIDRDFILRIPSLHEPFRGHQGIKQFVTGLRSAFPDIKFTVERQIAEGDKVASRFISISTHQGEFQGVPPTGNQIKDQGLDIFQVTGNKIAAIWVNENALGVMQQLGVV